MLGLYDPYVKGRRRREARLAVGKVVVRMQ
jgi:hypothetical protein